MAELKICIAMNYTREMHVAIGLTKRGGLLRGSDNCKPARSDGSIEGICSEITARDVHPVLFSTCMCNGIQVLHME